VARVVAGTANGRPVGFLVVLLVVTAVLETADTQMALALGVRRKHGGFSGGSWGGDAGGGGGSCGGGGCGGGCGG
jgi:hypothetical protein